MRLLIATGFAANAQRLTIGGYGEAMMTRNFYGDAWQRYNHPEQYKDDKSHGRFDIPHFVINLGYDFGKGWTLGTEIEFEHAERRPWRDRAGWTLGTEIEFEHAERRPWRDRAGWTLGTEIEIERGGTESAVELEADEAGEYESEIERGDEVALEQFWLQKAFSDAFKVRTGMIIIPVGLTSGHHLPTEFFTATGWKGRTLSFLAPGTSRESRFWVTLANGPMN